MHDLQPTTAMGGSAPQIDTFDHITISENDGLALASVAARMGHENTCHATLKELLGAVPEPGKAVLHDPESGFWIGPDQWMIGAPRKTNELLADDLKERFGNTASITEQTGAWVCFVIRRNNPAHIRILGPRASAGSLHHALITAAHSVA